MLKRIKKNILIGVSTPAAEKSESITDDSEDSDDDSSSDDENAFPDTQLESLPVTSAASLETEAVKTDKYDLDDYGQDSDEQDNAQTPSNGSDTPKKFITAKERRMMKKVNVTEITEEIKAQQEKQKQKQSNQKQKQAPVKPKVTAPPPPSRGRKGKAKKIKDKYADQDEEERQLRMELLGVSDGSLISQLFFSNIFLCSQTRGHNLKVKKPNVKPKLKRKRLL